MNAAELAKDDDYSLSCDLFDLMCNDDYIRKQLNKFIAERVSGVGNYAGKDDDKIWMVNKMIDLGADFYKERAYDNDN